MSDLSRLLDDVYGDTAPAVAPVPDPPTDRLVGLPDWAVDSVLDDAFADWVPGPPSAAVEDLVPSELPVVSNATAFRSAFADAMGEPEPAPEVPHGWCRDDDDILPTSRRGSRRSRGGGSAPAAMAPPTPVEAFAAPSEDVTITEPKPSRFRRRKG